MPYSKRKSVNRAKYNFLKSLHSLNHHAKDAILPYLSDDGCEAVFECIKNILENPRVRGRASLRKVLSGRKKDLRYLINPKVSITKKRQRTKKVGGAILSTILGAALPLLIGALTS